VEAKLGLVEEGDAARGSEVGLLLESEAGLFFQLLVFVEKEEFIFSRSQLRQKL